MTKEENDQKTDKKNMAKLRAYLKGLGKINLARYALPHGTTRTDLPSYAKGYVDAMTEAKEVAENKALQMGSVRTSLPLTNQALWDMAKTIVDKQREASKLTKPVDWNSLEEDWFDWLEEGIFGDES
jgi:hypothetical protein